MHLVGLFVRLYGDALSTTYKILEGEMLTFSVQLRVLVFYITITEKYANVLLMFRIERTFLNNTTVTVVLNIVTWAHSINL